jgi:dipeptidyl aminopeptidase/acylaminoacyl peptidase
MERLTTSEFAELGNSASPDGSLFAFTRFGANSDICLLNLRDKIVTPFLASSANESAPDFSPDGRWLAYCSDKSGRKEVYVCALKKGGKWQISSEGGGEPAWAKNGKQIFYRTEFGQGDKMWVVDVRTEPVFTAGKPRVLFDQVYFHTMGARGYDVSPDGQRFLMLKGKDVQPKLANEIVLVQNWFEELKRLAPIKK